MEGSGNGYLKIACDYVHLNPARANLLGQEDRLLAYAWSSLVWYLAAPISSEDHAPPSASCSAPLLFVALSARKSIVGFCCQRLFIR